MSLYGNFYAPTNNYYYDQLLLSEGEYFLVSRVRYFVSLPQSPHCFSDVFWLQWSLLLTGLSRLARLLHYLTNVHLSKY